MKLNELKKIIRTTIKSEVRKAIREELTEIMLGKEEKKPSLSKMVKPKKKVVRQNTNEVQYTSNPQLNEILNQTVGFNGGGGAGLEEDDKTISVDSSVAQSGDLRGRFSQLMGIDNAFQNTNGTPQGREANLVQTAAAMGRTADQVPDDVANALTRDYRDVMKAIDKKKGGGPLK
tara:strand:+ start:2621 stop:3145 length:525 start_codon:yes stop_codon:yes gene_type:complete